jgi:hypothetical protein
MSKQVSVKKLSLLIEPKNIANKLILNKKLVFNNRKTSNASPSPTNPALKDFKLFQTLLKNLLANPKMKQLVLDEIKMQTDSLNRPMINNLTIYRDSTVQKNTITTPKKTYYAERSLSNASISEQFKSRSLSKRISCNITTVYAEKFSPIQLRNNPQNKLRLVKNKPVSFNQLSQGKIRIIYIDFDEFKASTLTANISPVKSKKSINIPPLNFDYIAKTDFNEEFVANADKFSPSWRDCDRLKMDL